MRFEPDNPSVEFSTQQYLTEEERGAVRQRLTEALHAARSGGSEDGGRTAGSVLKSAAVIIVFLGIVIGIIAAASMNQPRIAAMIFGGAFILLGLCMVFGQVAVVAAPNSEKIPAAGVGVFLIGLGAAIVIPVAMVPRIGSAAGFIYLGGGVFGFTGLMLLVLAMHEAFRDMLPGDSAEGECIGYVRYLTEYKRNRSDRLLYSAPVFRWYGENGMTEAVGTGTEEDPEETVGMQYPLTVSRRNPYSIRRSDAKPGSIAGAVIPFLMAAAFLTAGIFLLYMGAHTSPNETIDIRRGDGKVILTDQKIVNDTGKTSELWEIALLTVTANEPAEDGSGWLITYSDGSRRLAQEEAIAKQYPVGGSFYFVLPKGSDKALAIYSAKSYTYGGKSPVRESSRTEDSSA